MLRLSSWDYMASNISCYLGANRLLEIQNYWCCNSSIINWGLTIFLWSSNVISLWQRKFKKKKLERPFPYFLWQLIILEVFPKIYQSCQQHSLLRKQKLTATPEKSIKSQSTASARVSHQAKSSPFPYRPVT